jgi:glycine cleavage system H lipoate-binding protein
MATARVCAFPDHLRYDMPNHLWYELLGDSSARVGMTVVAFELRVDPREITEAAAAGGVCLARN